MKYYNLFVRKCIWMFRKMWICKRLRHSSQIDDTNVKDDRKTYEKVWIERTFYNHCLAVDYSVTF